MPVDVHTVAGQRATEAAIAADLIKVTLTGVLTEDQLDRVDELVREIRASSWLAGYYNAGSPAPAPVGGDPY